MAIQEFNRVVSMDRSSRSIWFLEKATRIRYGSSEPNAEQIDRRK